MWTDGGSKLGGISDIMVQKEACEGRIIDIICIESTVVSIPIHLKPDLVTHTQVEEYRARSLVHILVLVLVIGEELSLVIPEEADLHILQIDCDVVGEVVQPRDAAVEFACGTIVVVLLIIEDLGEANGDIGDGDMGLQPHTEC